MNLCIRRGRVSVQNALHGLSDQSRVLAGSCGHPLLCIGCNDHSKYSWRLPKGNGRALILAELKCSILAETARSGVPSSIEAVFFNLFWSFQLAERAHCCGHLALQPVGLGVYAVRLYYSWQASLSIFSRLARRPL